VENSERHTKPGAIIHVHELPVLATWSIYIEREMIRPSQGRVFAMSSDMLLAGLPASPA
jgi:hypothetical protein